MIDLSKSLVYTSKDRTTIDVESTLTRVRAACEKQNASKEFDLTVVGARVDALFDQYPDANMGMDFIKSQVLGLLKATPTTHAMLGERVETYIKSYENSKFTIKRGVGVSRVRPQVEPAASTETVES